MKFTNFVSLILINAVLFLIPCYWRGTYIGRGSLIKCPTIIGRGTGISGRLSVRGRGRLAIGKFCAIGRDVKIITSGHDLAYPSMNFLLQKKVTGTTFPSEKRDVHILNDVWIGEGAIILPGVTIGNGAVIAAGAVVSKSVGDYEIHAGVPAAYIKRRFDKDLSERLLATAWWDWDDAKIRRNRKFFSAPASLASLNSLEP